MQFGWLRLTDIASY